MKLKKMLTIVLMLLGAAVSFLMAWTVLSGADWTISPLVVAGLIHYGLIFIGSMMVAILVSIEIAKS